MRGRLLNIPAITRAAGFAAVAVTIIVAAIHLGRHDTRSRSSANLIPPVGNPLARKLSRCGTLDISALKEEREACEAAWTENRRRFFGNSPASTAMSLRADDLQSNSKPEDR